MCTFRSVWVILELPECSITPRTLQTHASVLHTTWVLSCSKLKPTVTSLTSGLWVVSSTKCAIWGMLSTLNPSMVSQSKSCVVLTHPSTQCTLKASVISLEKCWVSNLSNVPQYWTFSTKCSSEKESLSIWMTVWMVLQLNWHPPMLMICLWTHWKSKLRNLCSLGLWTISLLWGGS